MVNKLNIPIETLINNAGNAIANHLDNNNIYKHVNAIIGKGNNGKDALVAIKQSKNIKAASLIIPFEATKTSKEFITLKKEKEIHIVENIHTMKKNSPLIDGLFGTGHKHIENQTTNRLILDINQQNFNIISIDVPSGLTEGLLTTCIKANQTLGIMFPKKAYQNNTNVCGKITVLKLANNHQWLEEQQAYISGDSIEIQCN